MKCAVLKMNSVVYCSNVRNAIFVLLASRVFDIFVSIFFSFSLLSFAFQFVPGMFVNVLNGTNQLTQSVANSNESTDQTVSIFLVF